MEARVEVRHGGNVMVSFTTHETRYLGDTEASVASRLLRQWTDRGLGSEVIVEVGSTKLTAEVN